MKIGIDAISFYVPQFYVELAELKRDLNFKKNLERLGQKRISWPDEDEDIVSMGIASALNLKDFFILEEIACVIFATESSGDLSKSAALFVKDIIPLKENVSCFEIKQACYASTVALDVAINYIKANPRKKVLIVSSDISHYEKFHNAEITQGAAAVSMIISANPRILEILEDSHVFSENVDDFYKPVNVQYPVLNGLLSIETYCKIFQKTYFANKGNDICTIVAHLPYVNIIDLLIKRFNVAKEVNFIHEIKHYARNIGNSYTASLYINICSLLENLDLDLSNKTLGLFAFGSGAIGKFFKARIVPGYKSFLQKQVHEKCFARQRKISSSSFDDSLDKNFPYVEDIFENRVKRHEDNKRKYCLSAK